MKFIGICIFFIAFFKSYACEIDTVYFHNSDSLAQWGIPKMGAELSNYNKYLLFGQVKRGDTIYCLEDSLYYTGTIFSDFYGGRDLTRSIIQVDSGIVITRQQLYYHFKDSIEFDFNKRVYIDDLSSNWIMVGKSLNWGQSATNFFMNGDTSMTCRESIQNGDTTYITTRFYANKQISSKSFDHRFPNLFSKVTYVYYETGGIYSITTSNSFHHLKDLSLSERKLFLKEHGSVYLDSSFDVIDDIEKLVFDKKDSSGTGKRVKTRYIHGKTGNYQTEIIYNYNDNDVLIDTYEYRYYENFYDLTDSALLVLVRTHDLPETVMTRRIQNVVYETKLGIWNDTLFHSQKVDGRLNGKLIQSIEGPDKKQLRLISFWDNGNLVDIQSDRVLFVDGVSKMLTSKEYVAIVQNRLKNNPDFPIIIIPDALKYDFQANLILYTPRSIRIFQQNPKKQDKSLNRIRKKCIVAREKQAYIEAQKE
jgi:hypothetical protein